MAPQSEKDAAVDAVDIAQSQYNPVYLSHIPQPVPKDLGSDMDRKVFTFQDAFEDLLQVSRGRDLPNIKTRYEQSKMLRQMYPHGEPTWLWLNRLEAQGLVKRPTSFLPLDAIQKDWNRITAEQDKLFNRHWHLMNSGSLSTYTPTGNTPNTATTSQTKSDGPDHFDDLFSWIKSTFGQSENSSESFRNMLNTPPAAPPVKPALTRQSAPITSGTKDNPQRVETREEYVDMFGFTHTTVKVKVLNEDGEQIGTEIYKDIRRVNKDS